MHGLKIDFGKPSTDPDSAAPAPVPSVIEYVGGPRDREREGLYGREAPAVIIIASAGGRPGSYQRSVRCADDHVLRYVWQEV